MKKNPTFSSPSQKQASKDKQWLTKANRLTYLLVHIIRVSLSTLSILRYVVPKCIEFYEIGHYFVF